MRNSLPVVGRFLALSMCAALPLSSLSGPALAQDQQSDYRYTGQPMPNKNLPVSPFFEGWYNNGDGTYTLSFGYLNRNNSTVHLSPGENNMLDLADVQGTQPSIFQPGRNRGVFAVTIPEQNLQDDVVWQLTNEGGAVHRVPGRARIESYELDWNPRPHGSLPPLMWFDSSQDSGKGPGGVMALQTLNAKTGEPVTLSVNVRDESERDAEDERFHETVPVRVIWSAYQGDPAGFEFSRHESNALPEGADGEDAASARPHIIRLPEAEGGAQVNVTFSRPGDYVFRAQADNFAGPDSAGVDQCCWSNAYQRVTVTE